MGSHLQRSSHDENKNIEIKKFCVDCKATETPLWRCGPSGPKTLCNACGIKYRKKNLVSAGLEKRGREKKLVSAGLEKRGRKKKKSRISTSTIGADSGNSDVGDTVKSLKTDGARNGMMSESLKIRLIVCGLARNGREEKNSYTRTSANGATNCSYSSADTVKTRVRNGLMSSEYLKMGLILRSNEMMFPKSPIVKKRRCQRRRKLGEEEQAAFSLMALSCGCFSMNKGRSVVQNGAKFLETSAHIP